MLARIADLVIRRRRAVLVGAVVLFAVGGGVGGDVAQHLSAGGFDDPGSESFQADEVLLERFDAGMPNIVLLATAPGAAGGDQPAVDAADAEAAGLALTERLGDIPGVTNVVSYWSIGKQAPLRSEDGTHALVLGRILGTQDEVDERIREIVPQLEGAGGVLDVEVTGYAETFRQVSDQIEHDLVGAETIALPITLILLLFVFRGVVAAMLPLAVGALSVVGTFLVLRMIASVTEVSIFALNLTTAMGLGLSIDYAPVRRQPLPGGARPRPRAARGGAPHRANGWPHGRLLGRDRRRLPARPARLPDRLPQVLRLRRRRRGRPGRPVLRRRPARHAGGARASRERPAAAPAPHGRPTRARGLLVPLGHAGHGPPGRHRHRRRGRARHRGAAVPRHRPRPARRPGAARVGAGPRRSRRHPRGVRVQRGRRHLGGGDRHRRHRRPCRALRHRRLRPGPVRPGGRRAGRRAHRHLRRRRPDPRRRDRRRGGPRGHRPVPELRLDAGVGGARPRAELGHG